MTKAILGKTPQGKEIPIDVTRLLETRMLVTAASGNGKSRTLRRVFEQTAPLVQQFIIDPEGEFTSLRERFDYVICAPSGADAVASPRTAALLARKLLESGVSAILDIYDLKPHDRHSFVKLFLEAMINAQKDLWRPVLVGLDEAHMFAPQNADCQSTGAVIDMATRGRKRGFCLVPATQRLSKLHKDVAAEMLNKMIGGIELDVDVKRASDDLGKTFKEGRAMLRNLNPGQFYVYGPALIRDITLVEVGAVTTTHPGPGQRTMKAPPAPSAKVMRTLKELADLPQQAAEEAKTTQELQGQVRELRGQLAAAEKRATAGGIPEAELKQIRAEEYQRGFGEGHLAGVSEAPAISPGALEEIKGALSRVRSAINQAAAAYKQSDIALLDSITGAQVTIQNLESAPKKPIIRPVPVKSAPIPKTRSAPLPGPQVVKNQAGQVHGLLDGQLSSSRQKILDTLLEMEQLGTRPMAKASLAAISGVSPKSSGYQNNLGGLRSAGLVEYVSGDVQLTDAGRAQAVPAQQLLSLREVHDRWLGVLDKSKEAILRTVLEAHPAGMSKTDLAEAIGVSPSSSGYQNNLGALRTLGAITYPAAGRVAASKLLFPEGLH